MKLEVKKDRLEINKIIENCLPLIEKNKKLTQDCADGIILYFIEKEKTSKTDKAKDICDRCGHLEKYHSNSCCVQYNEHSDSGDCLCKEFKSSQSKGDKKE